MAPTTTRQTPSRTRPRATEATRVTALVDALASQGVDTSSRRAVTRLFLSDVTRYLHELAALQGRFRGPALQDAELRAVFAKATDRVIADGERVVAGLDKTAAKQVKAAFREAIRPWTAQNPFVERCFKKPQGYAGDFGMMDFGYDDAPRLRGGLAGVFDRYFSDHYECVRQRKNHLRDAIRRYLYNLDRRRAPLQMLSLGSGPCREWVDLDREFRDRPIERSKVTLVQLSGIDRDPAALAYGRARLEGNALLASVQFVEQDLFQFTKAERWRSRAQSYDLIYGLGIANYFHDAMLQNIIACAGSLAQPGGELMITHKDSQTFNFPVADWVCDWVFLKRSAEEFSRLFEDAIAPVGRFAYRLERVPNGEIFFGIAKRIPG